MTGMRALAHAIDVPDLPGAACVGRHELFDPRRYNEVEGLWRRRVDTAKAICRECPALIACAIWAGAQPISRRYGTLAGRNYDRTKGRPRRLDE